MIHTPATSMRVLPTPRWNLSGRCAPARSDGQAVRKSLDFWRRLLWSFQCQAMIHLQPLADKSGQPR